MKKLVKYGLRVLVSAILLVLMIWIGIWAYVHFNKPGLIRQISERITEKTNGESTIGDLSVNLLQTFPFISIELADVVVKDSLWQVYNKTFFSAKRVYLRLSPFGLFNKNRGIGKVIITKGRLNLFTDSTNFNNQYILRSKKAVNKEISPLPDIHLVESELIMENPSREKYHHFNLREFTVGTTEKGSLQVFDIDTDMFVTSLAFNTTKGSY
ncbi:MAG TPA: AsmA family protein, partial [Flavitalea sp.]|nr:AsmA family protein [Flavitalea sp.]